MLLRLEVEFVQKRASVCKFAGRATIDGKLAAEANFTAMIADPPASLAAPEADACEHSKSFGVVARRILIASIE